MTLSNSYQHVIVGKSYVSIIFAIIEKKRSNVQNLIVDDHRFLPGNNWKNNIGEVELKVLKALGAAHDISCLKEIERHVQQTNTMIFMNEKMIELGASPFSNIKELARKMPERFSDAFIEGFSKIDPEKFDQDINAFFDFIVDKTMSGDAIETEQLFRPGSTVLDSVFQRFLENVRNDKLFTKQFHYILQALFQTILSNMVSETEVCHLLSSILSPRYQINTKTLEEELMFLYQNMGGDIKKTKIQNFEIYKNQLEYLLLESFEGLVKADEVFLFGHFKSGFPFEYETGSVIYQSIKVTCPIEHKFATRFKNKRILFSPSDRMGTDFPHWEVKIDDEGLMEATYVYAHYEGAKPSFYYQRASEDLFRSLKRVFPDLDRNDWNSQISFCEGDDVWLENINNNLNPQRQKVFSKLGSSCYYRGKEVKKLNYCGPLRSRFLGYFGYLLNILQNR